MTTILTDTFTQVSTVTLDAHTPDTGTSWTRIYQSDAGVDINAVAGDNCQQETQTDKGAIYTADASYDSADYYIQCTMVTLDANATKVIYLMVRIQDVDNMYAVRLNDQGGTNTCQLYKKVTGTWSTVGSAFSPPANGSVIKLAIVGTTLQFYDDGVSLASTTVTDHASAGKAGIGGGGGTNGGGELVNTTDDMSTSNVLDDLSIVTQPAGGATVVKDVVRAGGGLVPFAR